MWPKLVKVIGKVLASSVGAANWMDGWALAPLYFFLWPLSASFTHLQPTPDELYRPLLNGGEFVVVLLFALKKTFSILLYRTLV